DRGVVMNHVLGEVSHLLVLRLLQRELGRLDVDHARGVGDMGDLGVVGLGALSQRRKGCERQGKGRRGSEQAHRCSPLSRWPSSAGEALDEDWRKKVPGKVRKDSGGSAPFE